MTDVKHILVVEDDRNICEILEILLSDEGFQVTCKTTGQETIETLSKERFDLITLDMRLPDMSGNDLLHYFEERIPSTPVIVISANTNLYQTHSQVKAIISKPFDLEEVLNAIVNF
ncbi:MAG TPA: response regulator [Chloroflexia bacterium]|nr:response regulator [Chloroflexia bacterium]